MNSLMRKDNIVNIDGRNEKLIELSFKRRDAGDYVGAMSIMRNMLLNEPDADVYAHIADIYTDMGQYENAINYWYKYLSRSKKKYYIDGYNGLGANFFMCGNDSVAGYYFKKQMEAGPPDDLVYADVFEDYFDSLIESKNAEYKVVYPPNEEEENEKILDSARFMILNGEYGDAIDELNKIPETSEAYKKAEVSKAYAYYYLKMPDEAYREAKIAIDKGEISVYSLTVAIDVCAASACAGEVGRYLDLAINYKPDNEEEQYKKLHLLISLNLTAEAMAYSDTLLSGTEFISNVRFLRGILFYNAKRYNIAEEEFRYSYVLTSGPVAKFYRDISESAAMGNIEYKRIEPYFELPEKEVTRRVGVIKRLYDDKSTVDFPSEFGEIADWIYGGENKTLQVALAILIASRGADKYYDKLRDALIDAGVSDEVKQRILSIMCEYGFTGGADVVFGYIFRRITIPEYKCENETFRRAFAYALGKAAVFFDKFGKLISTAEQAERTLGENGATVSAEDIPALACYIYIRSGMKSFDDNKTLIEYFGVDEKSYFKLAEKLGGYEKG